MQRRATRLENSRWGFESNCFVCEASNPAGLRIPFFHDTERGEVVADLSLDGRFSGAPNYLHGGIALAVLDEAMAWATIALAETFAVTKETQARFLHPLRVGGQYVVTAHVVDGPDEELHCEGRISAVDGTPHVIASAVFVPLGHAQLVNAIGQAPVGDTTAFVRDRSRRDRDDRDQTVE